MSRATQAIGRSSSQVQEAFGVTFLRSEAPTVVTPEGLVFKAPVDLAETSLLTRSTDKVRGAAKEAVKDAKTVAPVLAQQRLDQSKHLLNQLDKKVADLAQRASKKRVGKLADGISLNKFEKLEKQTEAFYSKMRTTTEDITAISKNTGLPKRVIERIKNMSF